jgi:F-type H+-transporting ATPase subunit a
MDLLDWKVYAFYIVLTSVILIVFGIAAVSGRSKVPGRFQITIEWLMEYLRNTFMSALGEGGERHLPLIFGLFWYILFCDMLELIPAFKAATANPSTTIGLGIIVFVYTQYVGIKSKGIGPYLKHFLGPVLIMAPLFFVIEVLGEFVKPFSLGMRLFGNIYAEDIINDLAAKAWHGIPFQIIVYFLQIFTGVIQAFIFALLSCAYIGLMAETHHDDGEAYHNGEGGQTHMEPGHQTLNDKLADSIGSIGARVVEQR